MIYSRTDSLLVRGQSLWFFILFSLSCHTILLTSPTLPSVLPWIVSTRNLSQSVQKVLSTKRKSELLPTDPLLGPLISSFTVKPISLS